MTPEQDQHKTLATRLRTVLSRPIHEEDPLASSLIGPSPLELMRSCPEAVIRLAYSKLHSYYPFTDVPTCWRRCYEEACLWTMSQILERVDREQTELPFDAVDEIIRLCDDAIIMAGAPLRRGLINEVLDAIDSSTCTRGLLVSGSGHDLDITACEARKGQVLSETDEHAQSTNSILERPAKRPRYEVGPKSDIKRQVGLKSVPRSFPRHEQYVKLSKSCLRDDQSPGEAPTHNVPCISAPSLSAFDKLLNAEHPTPLIITDALNHWHALEKWKSPQYWMQQTHNGRRRVPVEWGKSYVDEGWGQSIAPFGDFLQSQLLDMQISDGTNDHTNLNANSDQTTRRKGYLAQHNLLGQIPALRKDIAIPDYCYCSSVEDSDDDDQNNEPLLNIWLGPADTVSPAHTDPHHNLLAQVVGRKYVRLYGPDQTQHMYPLGQEDKSAHQKEERSYSMANTSSVDVGLEVDLYPYPHHLPISDTDERPDLSVTSRHKQRQTFPDFHSKAQFVECTLEPGQMLFIPRGWWHYIRSLEISCNVSFWWD